MSDALIYTDSGAEASQGPRPLQWTLCEVLARKAFSRFRHGGLRISGPGVRTTVFGAEGAPVTAEIRVRRRAMFFHRVCLFGNVGLGEAYVDGDWDTPDISAVIGWFIENLHRTPETKGSSQQVAFMNLLRLVNRIHHWLRPNSERIAKRNIAEHYDLGNDFFSLWLDETMTYSAARFTRPGQSLAEAQSAKYDALCRKLKLQPTDHVLEIGCGWGGFSMHAAQTYGCRVTAITISEKQFKFATERVARAGLSDRIEVRLQDYRNVTGKFDKIASIEMLEAVGDKFLETYFAKCSELLERNGLLAVQMITVPDNDYKLLRAGTDWIQKHIFPGSLLLSIGRVNQALNRTGNLFMHELEDLGSSYARTLHEWWERFNAQRDKVKAQGFDDRFIRKWNYYLQYCEAAFATRNISVVQACYTRPNNATLRETWP
jgi:cyclopropane-fatty-acyl-phospholipid synthase